MTVSYIKAISIGFPNVQCSCIGDGSDYDNLVYEAGDSIPSKQDLDDYITENSNILNLVISDSKTTVTFNAKTTGAKNFLLSFPPDGITIGYYVDAPSVVRKLTFHSNNVLISDVHLKFREINTSEDIFVVVIPSGVKSYSIDTLFGFLELGTQLVCYLESSNNISDIVIMINVHERL